MRVRELAWFAGIFEGEGSITFGSGKQELSVRMTDRDIIERLHQIFPTAGGIKTHTSKKNPHYKTQYAWRVTSGDGASTVLDAIMPYLGRRRAARARECLLFIASRPGPHVRKTHCRQGHPYTGVKSDGSQECSTCRSAARKRHRAKHGDQIRAKGVEYRERNRDVLRARQREYYARNRERICAKRRRPLPLTPEERSARAHAASTARWTKHREANG